LDDLLTAGNRMTSMGVVNPAVSLWGMDAAIALAKLGYGSQAQIIASRQIAIARDWDASYPLGQSLLALALIETDRDIALRMMQDGVAVLEDSDFELALGRALVDLGRAQAGVGLQHDARKSLRQGLDLVHRCGAVESAEQAHAELVKSGARPRRRAQSGRNALTPAEERIAQMVIDGKTNREIAQELFVSLRTIELHLTNIYRKLRIVGRSGLVAVMDGRTDARTPSLAAR
jgi:DNA-binding CsgD family transcriptional regulator